MKALKELIQVHGSILRCLYLAYRRHLETPPRAVLPALAGLPAGAAELDEGRAGAGGAGAGQRPLLHRQDTQERQAGHRGQSTYLFISVHYIRPVHFIYWRLLLSTTLIKAC